MKYLINTLILIFSIFPVSAADTKFKIEQEEAAKQIDSWQGQEGSLTFLSLDPDGGRGDKVSNENKFHGFDILGKLEIKNLEEKIILLNSLAKSIRDNPGSVAACFNPRHGIKFVTGNKSIDLVICFECSSAQVYGINNNRGILLTGYANNAFNKILDDHKIRRAGK